MPYLRGSYTLNLFSTLRLITVLAFKQNIEKVKPLTHTSLGVEGHLTATSRRELHLNLTCDSLVLQADNF